jgi:putative sterol carrier protein
LSTLDEKPAEYLIRAPFNIWRKVIEGRLDPIQGMMTRKLKLQGNMMKIMRYPGQHKRSLAALPAFQPILTTE